MSKKLGLLVLLLGIALIVATAMDAFRMSEFGSPATGFGGDGALGQWNLMRLAFLAVGAVMAVWGAYGIARKPKQS